MYEQPKLPYAYDALEPHIDAVTMETHYTKHHAGYCKKYNAAIEGTEYEKLSIEEVVKNLETLPEDMKVAIRNNGGGAYNHSLFWEMLCPASDSGNPGEKTAAAINEAFGSFDEFKKAFSEAAGSVFGSGWAWLVVNESGKLEVVKTANQDNPVTQGMRPILGLDVWEHAYYLKYKNLRPDYIAAFFNVVNWKKVEKLFIGA